MKSHKKSNSSTRVAYIFLTIAAIIWIVPILFGFLTSFKSQTEISKAGFKLLPAQWVLENYVIVLSNDTSAPLMKWFGNSLFISISHTILMLIVVSTASYGYSRLHFKGRDALFTFLLAFSLFPSVVNLIPNYKIVDALGWVNSPLAVIIPGLAGFGNIFLVRQFMRGIPEELDEAAKIDGATDFQVFSRIILPLVKPVLTVVALFSFTGSWNDFLWPSIVFSEVEKLPITAGLRVTQSVYGNYMYTGQLLASAILALIPTFILFLFAQKYFVQAMNISSGVKG